MIKTLRVGLAGLMLVAAGCDALLVEPGTSPSTGLMLSIADDTIQYGDLLPVFSTVDLAAVSITSALSTRDTTVTARVDSTSASVRLQLRPEEAAGWIDLEIALIGDGRRLFHAEILDYAYQVAPRRSAVVSPIVGHVDVTPTLPEVNALGDTLLLIAQPFFATGQPIPGPVVRWSSSAPGVLEAIADDRLIARTNGTALLVGRVLDAEVAHSARVAQVPVELTGVAPSDTTVATGETFTIRPFGLDANGRPLLPGAQLSWTSAGGLSVTQYGEVAAVSPGVATAEVTFGGVTRTVTVTITP